VDIRIRGGQKVGIVGRTGSGKSSFLSALLRLNQIVGGDVVLDGVSILHLSRHDARRSVAWIPQQPDLFAGTLRFNLDPFMRHGDAELHAALRDVNLSLDLDMPVGEGGGNLSTGTRQLLSLARAVLLRRKVLLMDEATASVSFVEDQRIQNTLRTAPVFRDCTLVTIAHRINTVIESDLILVFADGKCIEQGSPQHLLATSGSVFAEMVRETRGIDTAMSKSENLG
jgi:ABC-type multidrug transport system fused ATPase/permease subunit